MVVDALEKLLAERRSPVPVQAPVTLPSAMELISQLTGKTIEELQRETEAASEDFPLAQNWEEVEDTPELRRIFNLPRRSIDYDGEETRSITERLTRAMAKPPTRCLPPEVKGGCLACRGTGSMSLLPTQAIALAEIFKVGGLIGPIRVGGGKTLLSYLAPQMSSVPSPRPLLVIPANLRRKTRDAFAQLHRHWKGPDPAVYKIISYEELGVVSAAEKLDSKGTKLSPGLLDKYKPTIIVLDEGHKAKNPKAAVTRRLLRYLHQNPTVRLVVLSGTLFGRSLKDFGPLTIRALGKLSPVPDSYKELEAWSGALDVKVSSMRRTQPGPLIELCTPAELATGPSLDALHAAYGRRFYQTPGVVASNEAELGTSLTFRERRISKPDPKVDAHFSQFRGTYITPQGLDVPDKMRFKAHALEMALGFEYHWDPQPPDDWRAIRKAWYRVVRYVLKHNRRNLDSEKQARDAILAGLYPGKEVWAEWQKVEPTFVPNTVGSWFSKEAIEECALWLEEHKGLVWVSHVAFAEALAKVTGLAYYGRKGMSAKGVYIMDAPQRYPAIASLESNKLGRDLQYHWSANLAVCMPTQGLIWEQVVARTHRKGQPEDEVTFDWLSNCTENIANYLQAVDDSRAQELVTGQPQKLQYGDKLRAPDPDTQLGRWGAKDEIPE
jgi:hypothetical protein